MYEQLTMNALLVAHSPTNSTRAYLYQVWKMPASLAGLKYATFARFNVNNSEGYELVSGSPDWQLMALTGTASAAYVITGDGLTNT